MKKIRTIYLFKFLEENSKYFTSVAFFGVLLTITLFVGKTNNPSTNQMITLLQSSSLMLLILCLFPLYTKIMKSDAKVLKIFGLLIFLLIVGLVGYLWQEYNGVLSGLLILVVIIIGIIFLNKVKNIIIALFKRNYGILKNNWYYILIFSIVVFINIVIYFYDFREVWIPQENNLVTMVDLFWNMLGYLFIGYVLGVILLILNGIFDIYNKIIAKVRSKR